MIRRPAGSDWLLISQVEHARIAAGAAEHWPDLIDDVSLTAPLKHAIRNHDNGWNDWERAPRIDPETGWVRNFTEMPAVDACAIWSHSIADCASHSPWGGIWVSRHFCWLAERGRQHVTAPASKEAFDRFLHTQHALQTGWMQTLTAPIGETHARQCADLGFRLVQFFDRLSLWLCCEPETSPKQLEYPGGPMYEFVPMSPTEIVVRPYPFDVRVLEFDVPVARLPQQRYADDAALQAALRDAPQETLRWRLSA
ncbi:MAG TPA: DUF3891 family protein [Planctomycetaceae bacterium]|nr:DUF3891 family protein [Planctomycetaceae bacterium]